MEQALPTTSKGRETRARIVKATSALVGERGTGEIALDDVRAAANVSKSQLYHYFADRDDLVRAAVQDITDTVLDLQADLFTALDTRAGFERWADALVDLQVQRHARGGCPIGSLAGQLAEHDDRARRLLADGMDRWEAPIRDGLRRMHARGDLRRDPDVLAVQVLAAVQGGLLLTQLRRDPQQLRIALDGALELIAG